MRNNKVMHFDYLIHLLLKSLLIIFLSFPLQWHRIRNAAQRERQFLPQNQR